MVGRLIESGTYLGPEYRLESRADQVISLFVSPIDPEMPVSNFHILLACASGVHIGDRQSVFCLADLVIPMEHGNTFGNEDYITHTASSVHEKIRAVRFTYAYAWERGSDHGSLARRRGLRTGSLRNTATALPTYG